MVEVVLALCILVAFFISCFIIVRTMGPLFFNTITAIVTENGKSQQIFYEMVKEMQIEHFKTLESSLATQMTEMDKRQKELLKILYKQPSPTVEQVVEKADNEIEKKEDDEFVIPEGMKIPINENTKVKFEDEEVIGDDL